VAFRKPGESEDPSVTQGVKNSSPLEEPSIAPVERHELGELVKLIRELAEFEKLLDQAVATESSLEAALFCDRPVPQAILARVQGEIVGFALFFHNFSTFLGRSGLYLEDLYVRPQYRGKGYGDALLRHLARVAVERGCGRMEWAVLNWNQRAIDFYRKMGARPMNEWTVFRLDGDSLLRACMDAQ
jgi:GNAT superfamily N-acetyltransferase